MWHRKTSLVCNNNLLCKLISDVYNHFHTSSINNAGHSKWANIRHIKAQKDGQKSALFTKYTRKIRIAIQDGGSHDPVLNSQLRNIIDDALRKNMPMGTIQNCIKKTITNKIILRKHFLYWRFQQKVFVICSLYTENFPQLKMELSPVLRKSGAVYVEGQHMFDEMGIIEAVASDKARNNTNSLDEFEQICTEDAIECGVEEVEVLDKAKGTVNFLCNPLHIGVVSLTLKERGYLIENAEHIFVPKNTVQLSEDEIKAYQKFVTRIREFSGIEEMFDNIAFTNDKL